MNLLLFTFFPYLGFLIFPWPVSRECLPQEPSRIEYNNHFYLSMWSFWGCLRFKPHWMFQNNKKVIKGHKELISCSSLMHSKPVSVARRII